MEYTRTHLIVVAEARAREKWRFRGEENSGGAAVEHFMNG
jgi:hypothetical protein